MDKFQATANHSRRCKNHWRGLAKRKATFILSFKIPSLNYNKFKYKLKL
jgi:hypothetical protein